MKIKKIIFCSFALLYSIIYCNSQSADINKQRFALVIGNQHYEESPLDNSIKDSQSVAAVLNNCGFDITLLNDLNDSELRIQIGEYVNKIEENGDDSISLFYYSGHGVQVKGKNYIVPINDRNIDSESKVRTICYSVDDLLETIPSKTQIVIMDACRNNPFKSEKINVSKGLSQIKGPKGVAFCYLFSTQAGETAADGGSDGNSLFTSCLVRRLNEYNTSVISIFNEVSQDVKTQTNNIQTPLFMGSSVDFNLMDENIAKAKIDSLKNELSVLSLKEKKNVDISADEKKENEARAKLLQADISNMENIKKKAEEDSKKKREAQNQKIAQDKKQKDELDKQEKELAKAKKALQEQKAKENRSYEYIDSIEKDRAALQRVRKDAADKIINADIQTQTDADIKIDDINNEEPDITQLTSKGELTSAAKKIRKNRIEAVENECIADKQKNFNTYYDVIKNDEEEYISKIQSDLKTLQNAKYTASTLVQEIEINISNYDGEKYKWTVDLESLIYNDKSLFKTTLDLPYEILSKIDNMSFRKPELMSDKEIKDYSDEVTKLDILFNGSHSPLIAECDYTVKYNQNSVYTIVTSEARIYYLNTETGNKKLIAKQSVTNSKKITWNTVTQNLTVEDYVKLYEKQVKKQERAQKREEKIEKLEDGTQKIKGVFTDLYDSAKSKFTD